MPTRTIEVYATGPAEARDAARVIAADYGLQVRAYTATQLRQPIERDRTGRVIYRVTAVVTAEPGARALEALDSDLAMFPSEPDLRYSRVVTKSDAEWFAHRDALIHRHTHPDE